MGIYIGILALSLSLIPFAIDPHLPTFPYVADFFGLPQGTIQSSIVGVTIGIAVGQILIGPLTDAFGRRLPMIIAMLGFAGATLLVMIAPSFEVFLFLRFLMGLFGAAADVIGRAIVRDLFRGQAMQQMLSRIFMFQALSPILGPIVGAQLLGVGPWQNVFLVFGLVGLALSIFSMRFLVETLPVAQRRSPSITGMLRGYRSVLRDPVFVGLMFFGASGLAGIFGYLNTVPILYQESFGLDTASFGLWVSVNAIALWFGFQSGGIMAKRFRAQWMLLVYAIAGLVVGGLMITTAGSGLLVAELLFLAQLFLFGSAGTSIPTLALYNHGTEAGSASSLLGMSAFGAASIFGAIAAGLDASTTLNMGIMLASFSAFALIVIFTLIKPWLMPDLRDKAEAKS
ncbi:MFS transporter, DHA1 family, bicyclomycin/chloramphenicol resistance protein [Candidatus Aquiluna sp. UB-MaderosW2red]|nr:MFS transporter, DHA1 family, bicyclomycin/chloramphenicol resistance protein [Candidatus Aquiluna sp. UB-MaderosW2red]